MRTFVRLSVLVAARGWPHDVRARSPAGRRQARQAGAGGRHAARRLRGAADSPCGHPHRRRSDRAGRPRRRDDHPARLPDRRHQWPHHDAGHDRAARAPHPARSWQLRRVVPLDRQAGSGHAHDGDGDCRPATARGRRHVGGRSRRAAQGEPRRARPDRQRRRARPAHVDERPVDHPPGRRHDRPVRRHRGDEFGPGRGGGGEAHCRRRGRDQGALGPDPRRLQGDCRHGARPQHPRARPRLCRSRRAQRARDGHRRAEPRRLGRHGAALQRAAHHRHRERGPAGGDHRRSPGVGVSRHRGLSRAPAGSALEDATSRRPSTPRCSAHSPTGALSATSAAPTAR